MLVLLNETKRKQHNVEVIMILSKGFFQKVADVWGDPVQVGVVALEEMQRQVAHLDQREKAECAVRAGVMAQMWAGDDVAGFIRYFEMYGDPKEFLNLFQSPVRI
jgi:hypothetical protein